MSRERGRPVSTDPKIKYEGVRLRTSLQIDIELICEKLAITKSQFTQTILEKEVEKYKNFFKIE